MSQKIYVNKLSESKSTDTFDIEKFNRLKTGHQYYDTLDDGTIIRYLSSDVDFEKEEPPPFPAILEVYSSFHLNGKLKLKGLHYPSRVELGVWREYDEKGNLITEENYDEGYEYSFEEVINFMLLHSINIRDKMTIISRTKGNWGITYLLDGFPFYWRTIILDGKTGKKLEDKKREINIVE